MWEGQGWLGSQGLGFGGHELRNQYRRHAGAVHEIVREYHEEALYGRRRFCLQYFEEIIDGNVHLISGSWRDLQEALHLKCYLFDFDKMYLNCQGFAGKMRWLGWVPSLPSHAPLAMKSNYRLPLETEAKGRLCLRL